MCCESDGCVIPIRRAARVNDPSSTTATKHASCRKFIGRSYRSDCHRLLDLLHAMKKTPSQCARRGSTTSASRRAISRSPRGSTRACSRWSGSRRRRSSRRCSGCASATCSSISSSTTAPRRHGITSGSRSTTSTPRTTRSRSTSSDTWGWQLVELPSRQVQLYFRDPAENLIELNWPDADLLDRSRYPELRKIAEHFPQRARTRRKPSSTCTQANDRIDPAAAGDGTEAAQRSRRAGARAPDRRLGGARRARGAARALGALLRADDRPVRDDASAPPCTTRRTS